LPDPGGAAPEDSAPPAQIGATTDFSCEPVEIRDPERSRWRFSGIEVAGGDGFEQVRLGLQQRSGREREAGTVRTGWLTPEEAVERYEIPRPAGARAVAMTFEGSFTLDSDRTLDASVMEANGLDHLRSVQITTDPEGRLVAVVGIADDGCARLSSPNWKKKGADRNAKVLLDLQTR
jgi:hypothetical protein